MVLKMNDQVDNVISSMLNQHDEADTYLSKVVDVFIKKDDINDRIKKIVSMNENENFPEDLDPEMIGFIKTHSKDIFLKTKENLWTLNKDKVIYHIKNDTKGSFIFFMMFMSDKEDLKLNPMSQFMINHKKIEDCINEFDVNEDKLCKLIEKGLDDVLKNNTYIHGWLYANKMGMDDFANTNGGRSKILEKVEDNFNEIFKIEKTESSINYDVLSKLGENDSMYKRSEIYLELYYQFVSKTPYLPSIVKNPQNRN